MRVRSSSYVTNYLYNTEALDGVRREGKQEGERKEEKFPIPNFQFRLSSTRLRSPTSGAAAFILGHTYYSIQY